MHIWYFIEIDRLNFTHLVLHKVNVPNLGEKDFYRQVSSLNAFIQGIRKNASVKDKINHQDGCEYSNSKIYHGMNETNYQSLIQSQIHTNQILAHLNQPTLTLTSELPIIHHNNIFDFQIYIKFNHKTRKYDIT